MIKEVHLANLAAMGEALAILAAVLFALGTVLQQKGTLSHDGERAGDDPRFLLQDPPPDPVWLAGAMVLQSTVGWVVQAMAL